MWRGSLVGTVSVTTTFPQSFIEIKSLTVYYSLLSYNNLRPIFHIFAQIQFIETRAYNRRTNH